MKKSNIGLIAFGIVILMLLISSGLQSSHYNANNVYTRTSNWLEALGPEIVDTVFVGYHHLVCDFPVTSLDAQSDNTLIIRGSKNGIPYSSAKVKNDTLFLEYIAVDPNYKVADNKVNGRYPIHLIVGAKSLKSITVLNQGKIFIDANPAGSNEGEPVYDSLDHLKNFLEYDEINIALERSAQLKMFMHTKEMNLSTSKFIGAFHFEGHINTFNFKYPEGSIGYAQSQYINVDTANIYYNSEIKNGNAGILKLNCSKFLFAELRADMDVYYKGNPTLRKIETDFGRVINSNEKVRPEPREVPIQKVDSTKVDEIVNKSISINQSRDSILLIRNTSDQLINIPM